MQPVFKKVFWAEMGSYDHVMAHSLENNWWQMAVGQICSQEA